MLPDELLSAQSTIIGGQGMSNQVVSVGLGDMFFGDNPSSVYVCYGLGSCIGLSMYDPKVRLGGLAHIVLPDSTMARTSDSPMKFADTCVPAMLDKLLTAGAVKSRLIIKIAGGARVLNISEAGTRLDIGSRNIEAVETALRNAGLRINARDVGGTFGRTMQLYIVTGNIMIKTVGRGEKQL